MNFKKTTEYALRILTYMANDENRSYNTSQIYDELKIPFRYLRRLMTNLTKTGFLISIQGKYGGFKLAKKIEDISLFEIINSSDDDFFNKQCFFGFQSCSLAKPCRIHNEWEGIRSNIIQVLSSTLLSDMKDPSIHINI